MTWGPDFLSCVTANQGIALCVPVGDPPQPARVSVANSLCVRVASCVLVVDDPQPARVSIANSLFLCLGCCCLETTRPPPGALNDVQRKRESLTPDGAVAKG